LVDRKSGRAGASEGHKGGGRGLQRERQLRRSLEVLHSSAVGLIEAKSIDEVYATCIDVADTILSGGDGTIGVVEGDDVVFRYITRSLRDGYAGFSIPLRGSGVVNRALRAKAAVYVPDVSKSDEYVKPGGIEEDVRYMSELAVPIMVDDEPVAAINFESVKVDGFDGQARKLLEMLSLYAATSIRRLRILEEERRRAAKLEALLRVAFQLNEAKAPEEVFRIATMLVKRDFGFEWVGTGAVEGEWLRYTYYLGPSIGGSDKIHLSQRSVMVRAVKTGETQVVRDVRLDPDYMLLRDVDQSFLSELAVPVKVDGEVRAVINVESTRLDAFTEVDRSLLELLALQVSSSLGRLTRVEDLERQVALKTGELLDAERLAAVGRVASMVAHDLRSPLQSIRNAAYLVKREPSKAMEFCPLIDESVAYASKIVEDLRDATAPIQLKRMPVNLVDVVTASLDAVEVPGGIEVHRKPGDGFIAASVDPVRLRRALENLVKNAVEAMPGGGVLTVSLTRVDEEAVISVGDTGKGIPEESLPNVFKPFFSTKPRGTGLGLAIAKQSVEAHGGTIEFESVQGVGTVFTVRLPLSGKGP